MKTSPLFRTLFVLAFLASFSFGCNKDACQGLDCGFYGDCNDGNCTCDPGFLPDDQGRCEVAVATQISGTYQASNQNPGCTIPDYFLTIQQNPGQANGLLISNLGSYTCNSSGSELLINAAFTSNSQFDIDATDRYCNQYSIIGSGTISETDSSITLSYRAEYEIGSGSQAIDNCTVLLTKQ